MYVCVSFSFVGLGPSRLTRSILFPFSCIDYGNLPKGSEKRLPWAQRPCRVNRAKKIKCNPRCEVVAWHSCNTFIPLNKYKTWVLNQSNNTFLIVIYGRNFRLFKVTSSSLLCFILNNIHKLKKSQYVQNANCIFMLLYPLSK